MTNLEYRAASELEARNELQLPRRTHRCDAAEAGAIAGLQSEVGRRRIGQAAHLERRIDVVELRVIERVEGVKTQFKLRRPASCHSADLRARRSAVLGVVVRCQHLELGYGVECDSEHLAVPGAGLNTPDELMIHKMVYDHSARLRTYEIVADVWKS
jgi:hypothetical protein